MISSFLEDCLEKSEGLFYPAWDRVDSKLPQDASDEQLNEIWIDIARSWIELNSEALGAEYSVYESEEFFILAHCSKRESEYLLKTYERLRIEILENLQGVASDDGYGKHVVLMLGEEDYYRYISYFYPDGDHVMSGGLCIEGTGYVHFAFQKTELLESESILAHELTHGCLSHLPLPLWLNEALAMRMEESLCQSPVFHLDQELAQRHADYWNENSIQDFWAGLSWENSAEGNELSYSLAQIIWRKIEGSFRSAEKQVFDFIAVADFKDAGEDAFQQQFGMSLGSLVSDFLGEGNWKPDIEKLHQIQKGMERAKR